MTKERETVSLGLIWTVIGVGYALDSVEALLPRGLPVDARGKAPRFESVTRPDTSAPCRVDPRNLDESALQGIVEQFKIIGGQFVQQATLTFCPP